MLRWQFPFLGLSYELPATLRALLELDLRSCAEKVFDFGEVVEYGCWLGHGSIVLGLKECSVDGWQEGS